MIKPDDVHASSYVFDSEIIDGYIDYQSIMTAIELLNINGHMATKLAV